LFGVNIICTHKHLVRHDFVNVLAACQRSQSVSMYRVRASVHLCMGEYMYKHTDTHTHGSTESGQTNKHEEQKTGANFAHCGHKYVQNNITWNYARSHSFIHLFFKLGNSFQRKVKIFVLAKSHGHSNCFLHIPASCDDERNEYRHTKLRRVRDAYSCRKFLRHAMLRNFERCIKLPCEV
jgi:hypothetical protein